MRPVMSVLLRTATEVLSVYGLRVAGSVPVQLHSRSHSAQVDASVVITFEQTTDNSFPTIVVCGTRRWVAAAIDHNEEVSGHHMSIVMR